MEIRRFCEMMFTTSKDSTRSVRIPQPCSSIDATMITDAAGLIINANPFDETVGQLVELRRADIVRVNRIVLI